MTRKYENIMKTCTNQIGKYRWIFVCVIRPAEFSLVVYRTLDISMRRMCALMEIMLASLVIGFDVTDRPGFFTQILAGLFFIYSTDR